MKPMHTHETPSMPCPMCQADLNMATGVDCGDKAPVAGDYTVCAHCGEVLSFTKDMNLVPVSKQEIDEMDPATRVVLRKAQLFAPAFRGFWKDEV